MTSCHRMSSIDKPSNTRITIMAFRRRVLPISKDVQDYWKQLLQQERDLREQQVSQLQEQINDLKRNTSVSDMPDYINARLVWSLTDQGRSRIPIIKVNAPCWILDTSAGRFGDNQDCTITLGGSAYAWNEQLTEKLVGLQGVCSDDYTGGGFIAPVYPGTSTYASMNWYRSDANGTYMFIIPTISTTKYFDQQGISYDRLFEDTGVILAIGVSNNRNKIAVAGSPEYRKIFAGDWRDNFK